MLSSAAMFALGLLIAALAPNGRAAAVSGTMLLLPLMFFAGLWIPQATMPAACVTSGVHAARRSRASHAGQHVRPLAAPVGLAVLAGYAVVFAVAAARFFRWD